MNKRWRAEGWIFDLQPSKPISKQRNHYFRFPQTLPVETLSYKDEIEEWRGEDSILYTECNPGSLEATFYLPVAVQYFQTKAQALIISHAEFNNPTYC